MTRESPTDRLGRSSNEILEATSFLFGANTQYLEELYSRYLEEPESVDPSWRSYFDGLRERGLTPAQLGRGPEWRRDIRPEQEDSEIIGALTGLWPRDKAAPSGASDTQASAHESIRAIQLVRAYRVIGHLAADLDPLKLAQKPPLPQLNPNFYGFHDGASKVWTRRFRSRRRASAPSSTN